MSVRVFGDFRHLPLRHADYPAVLVLVRKATLRQVPSFCLNDDPIILGNKPIGDDRVRVCQLSVEWPKELSEYGLSTFVLL